MIRSFGDRQTARLFHGQGGAARRLPPEVARVALRKLDMLEAARDLRDLLSPPGNRLEALRGALSGRFSVRVNDQWRIVFRWEGGDAWEVRLTDYH